MMCRVAIALLLASVVAPSSAKAATLAVTIEGDVARYVAAAGEANSLTVVGEPSLIRFVDPGAVIVASANCSSVAPHEATCERNPYLDSVRLELGDGDDTAWIAPACPDCVPTATFVDGPGNDICLGGSRPDRFYASSSSNGADVYRGGGNWLDDVNYGDRENPVRVSLDGRANDGERNEGDSVFVEGVLGGQAGTMFIGNGGPNVFSSGVTKRRLADVVIGRGGRDIVEGGWGADVLLGGLGKDYVYGGLGRDRIAGGPGADDLFGGKGDDRMRGGRGMDRLIDGSGNDTYYAADGVRDLLYDGSGFDRARIDFLDTVGGIEVLF